MSSTRLIVAAVVLVATVSIVIAGDCSYAPLVTGRACDVNPCPEGFGCISVPSANGHGKQCHSDYCTRGACPPGKRCVNRNSPINCFTTPCPQFTCVDRTPDVCAGVVCASGKRCVPSPKMCLVAPCPQYACATITDNDS